MEANGVPANCPKVYIQRDYSDGMAVKFEKFFPRELETKVGHCIVYTHGCIIV